MSRCRLVVVSLLAVVVIAASGCGGSGGDGGAPGTRSGTQTFDFGAVRGEAAASAGFSMIHFDAGPSQPVAFTCLSGARIITLDEWGYGQLAVSLHDSGRWGIGSVSVDGWHTHVLRNSKQHDGEPAVSPDGQHIAYTRWYAAGHSDIYVMKADGSFNQNITTSGHKDYSPAWDPVTQRIAFVSDRDGNPEIHVWAGERAGITQVTDEGDAADPAWSPDGRRIAFASDGGGGPSLCTCSPAGTHVAVLAAGGYDETEPSWSPDGAQLAYTRTDRTTSRSEVWVVDADGTNHQALASDPRANYYSPAWSPDGRRIAFERDYHLSSSDTGIVMIDLSSGLVTHVTPGPDQYAHPAWFPNPSMLRRLVGPGGSDHGADPSLGEGLPLVVVGLTQAGLVSAAAVGTGERHWPSLHAEALPNTGSQLAGLAVTGDKIRRVKEDMGRTVPPKCWDLLEWGDITHVAIFFSGETGHIVSVIAGQDVALADGAASADTIRLRGPFTEAYDAREASRNRLSAETEEITIDAHTGEVLSAG